MEHHIYLPPATSAHHPAYISCSHLSTNYRIHTLLTTNPTQSTHIQAKRKKSFRQFIPAATVAITYIDYPTLPRQYIQPICTLTARISITPGTTQEDDPCYQQCHAFNHVSQHTTRLERVVTSRPHLRRTLTAHMYQPHSTIENTPQTTINNIIIQHPT